MPEDVAKMVKLDVSTSRQNIHVHAGWPLASLPVFEVRVARQARLWEDLNSFFSGIRKLFYQVKSYYVFLILTYKSLFLSHIFTNSFQPVNIFTLVCCQVGGGKSQGHDDSPWWLNPLLTIRIAMKNKRRRRKSRLVNHVWYNAYCDWSQRFSSVNNFLFSFVSSSFHLSVFIFLESVGPLHFMFYKNLDWSKLT